MNGRIFVSRRIPRVGLDLLRAAGAEVEVGQSDDELPIAETDLEVGLARADVLLCQLTERIDADRLARHPRLRGVSIMAVGYDNVDVPAATAAGVPVSNTPGVLTETTADFTLALLLAVARRVPEGHRYAVEGRFRSWGPNLMLGHDVGPGPDGRRKVLGIVGFGRIGVAVARRASGFDMRIVAHDPRHRPQIESAGFEAVGLIELLETADFVSLHCPLTPETRHLVSAVELGRMKKTAFLINTARGPIVDESALVTALERGELAGAALDVFEREPEITPGLLDRPDVVLAPHIASASTATREKMATIAARAALAHLRGDRSEYVVDPEVYEGSSYRRRVARYRGDDVSSPRA